MMKWHVVMLLAADLSFLHYIADGKDVTTLRVCEGSVANFPNDYDTTDHDGLKYSFRGISGHLTRIYDKETSGKKPIIHDDYIHRFNRISRSGVGFTLSKVSSSDEGDYACLILYSDGTEKRFAWTLRVEDSRNLTKPKIRLVDKESGCVKYNCSHNETVEVDVYWKFGADKRVNGSSLYMCENNRTETIKCIIKSFCKDAYKENKTKEIGRDFPGGKCITDSQTIMWKLAAGLSLLILLAFVVFFCCYLKRQRRKRETTKGDVLLT